MRRRAARRRPRRSASPAGRRPLLASAQRSPPPARLGVSSWVERHRRRDDPRGTDELEEVPNRPAHCPGKPNTTSCRRARPGRGRGPRVHSTRTSMQRGQREQRAANRPQLDCAGASADVSTSTPSASRAGTRVLRGVDSTSMRSPARDPSDVAVQRRVIGVHHDLDVVECGYRWSYIGPPTSATLSATRSSRPGESVEGPRSQRHRVAGRRAPRSGRRAPRPGGRSARQVGRVLGGPARDALTAT